MQLFNRDGFPRASNTSDGKGYRYRLACGRCGGAGGSEAWRYTGYTCYDCGGSGVGPTRIEKLYTEEQLAKLNARRDAAREKKAAERAAEQARIAAERDAEREAWLALPEIAEIMRKAEEVGGFAAEVAATARERASLSDRQEQVINDAYARKVERDAKIARANAAPPLLSGTVGFYAPSINAALAELATTN